MKPSVYLESTIPSYLVARPSRDLIMAGHQQVTQTWWQNHRDKYELYISQLVIRECEAGDPEMAAKRSAILTGIKALEIGPESLQLAIRLTAKGPLPSKAENDAFHIAVAAVNAMDYLLSWNLKHILKGIEAICRYAGFEPPVICTPDTLLGEEEGYVE